MEWCYGVAGKITEVLDEEAVQARAEVLGDLKDWMKEQRTRYRRDLYGEGDPEQFWREHLMSQLYLGEGHHNPLGDVLFSSGNALVCFSAGKALMYDLPAPRTPRVIGSLAPRDITCATLADDALCVGTGAGVRIFSLTGGESRRWTEADGLPSNEIAGIAWYHGRLCLGLGLGARPAKSGLAWFDPEDGSVELIASSASTERQSQLDGCPAYAIRGLLADEKRECIWIGISRCRPNSREHGLWRYEPATGKIERAWRSGPSEGIRGLAWLDGKLLTEVSRPALALLDLGTLRPTWLTGRTRRAAQMGSKQTPVFGSVRASLPSVALDGGQLYAVRTDALAIHRRGRPAIMVKYLPDGRQIRWSRAVTTTSCGVVTVVRTERRTRAYLIAKRPPPRESAPPTIDSQWPFDAEEARRRQAATAEQLGVPVECEEDLGNGLKLPLVLVPPGVFIMGSPENEKGRCPREGPCRPVPVTEPFYIGKHEITVGQWNAVQTGIYRRTGEARRPASAVGHAHAQHFLRNLNAKLRKREGEQFSLPTEAQWEYACRAGSNARFCFGDDPKCERLDEYAWFKKEWWEPGGAAHPVGQKKPNAWGLHDMHGNVYEWCQDRIDWYAAGAASAPAAPGGRRPSDYVLRGGSAFSAAACCRSAYRDWADRGNEADKLMGLRVVRGIRRPEK